MPAQLPWTPSQNQVSTILFTLLGTIIEQSLTRLYYFNTVEKKAIICNNKILKPTSWPCFRSKELSIDILSSISIESFNFTVY